MDAGDANVRSDLRTLASQLTRDVPDASRFVAEALGEVDRLHALLACEQDLRHRMRADTSTAVDRLAGLQGLLVEQADELDLLRGRLIRIKALCDLAEWATVTAGGSDLVGPRVLVGDLLRALAEDA